MECDLETLTYLNIRLKVNNYLTYVQIDFLYKSFILIKFA